MSKVDEETKPDWRSGAAKEGIIFCDSRCFCCKCCNHAWDLTSFESNWGKLFSEDDQIEYLIYQFSDPLPVCLETLMFPCMLYMFAIFACFNVPAAKALVIGYDKRKNEAFACVREKGYFSGWDSSRRQNVFELSILVPDDESVSSKTEITVHSNDSRIPLKVEISFSRDSRYPDAESFVKTCNKMLSKSRGESELQEADVARVSEPTLATAVPYNERDSIELERTSVVNAPEKVDVMYRDPISSHN